VSIAVDTFGTARVPDQLILQAIADVFDLTPKGIISALVLRKPIYTATASYGHFGRAPERVGSGRTARTYFSWERIDRVAALRQAVKNREPESRARRNGRVSTRLPSTTAKLLEE
jgi:S-adenosylmethionine synthetase